MFSFHSGIFGSINNLNIQRKYLHTFFKIHIKKTYTITKKKYNSLKVDKFHIINYV